MASGNDRLVDQELAAWVASLDRGPAAFGQSIDARMYEPAGAGPSVIVYLHGGMWLLWDLETHDRTCRHLADATRTRVVAVDFRRGPEHRWRRRLRAE